MCGVAGALSLDGSPPLAAASLRRMLGALHHRGPDGAGSWQSADVVLGHARLSIVDVAGGRQPLANEDQTVWGVVNGEVFNHVELAAGLRRRGHVFRTRSDSEVVLHLYEELGTDLLAELNGQFAFALWDERRRRLVLARDRLGVRPMFYTVVDGVLLFASEVKALLCDRRVRRSTDLQSLDQVFTYWSALPGRTMFEGIHEVPAGHYLVAEPGDDQPVVTPYWDVRFGGGAPTGDDDERAEQLRALLVEATRLRLQADVPVGAYLSGGLDSAAITAIAARGSMRQLQTFSVAFDDPVFDESRFQSSLARDLGTDHHVVQCGWRDIGRVFPDVIRHAETPLLRTAPAPMFLLSELVRDHGIKVVLTGEGADEFLAGYDIFKEALIRRFWARDPSSSLRPALLRTLYPWLPDLSRSPTGSLQAFFEQGLTETDDVAYSHALRWRSTRRVKRLFSAALRDALSRYDSRPELDELLEPELGGKDTLSKAQYLEVRTFLTPYLLSSQGDRMAMAHSVEGRFPFLDHRVVEFAAALPPGTRMAGLNEKSLLKRAVRDLVPSEIRHRPKQPYRAPIAPAFCGPGAPSYVDELLSPAALEDCGLFDPTAVGRLRAKCASGRLLGEVDNMALVGVLSTQLWHRTFLGAQAECGARALPDVVDVRQNPSLATAV